MPRRTTPRRRRQRRRTLMFLCAAAAPHTSTPPPCRYAYVHLREPAIFCLLNEALKMHGARCSNKRCHSLYERHLSTYLKVKLIADFEATRLSLEARAKLHSGGGVSGSRVWPFNYSGLAAKLATRFGLARSCART